MPLLLWTTARAAKTRFAFLLRFFAGFCLIVNGLYLGVGSFQGVGDCGDLLRHGAVIWQLWLFAIVTAPTGLALWHGLGPRFGFGRQAQKLDEQLVLASVLVAIALTAIPLLLSTN